jgi:ssDNA-binding Zn-finger/Zn-ribbon topoisomerase 1
MRLSPRGRSFWKGKIKFPGVRIIMAIEPSRDGGGLADVIERILDKGLVINADIAVSVTGVELLGLKIRAALASFETAAKYGLEFPSGAEMETPAWKEALVAKENCPQCEKKVSVEDLISTGCPWCGWVSAKAKAQEVVS